MLDENRLEDLSALGVDSDWVQRSIDVSSYADGASHTLKMSYTHSGGDTDWDYYLDDATIDCTQNPASQAHPVGLPLSFSSNGKRRN